MSYHDLGKIYPITLPVIGASTVDIPLDAIVHDAYDATLAEMWQRTKNNWPYLLGLAMLVGAVVVMRKGE